VQVHGHSAGVKELIPLFELGEPMWPEALAHYFFAASGNDSFARMVLGYRHMQGLGVPRSCQTAVLYYQPVAEEVVELARAPDSLPFVSFISCIITTLIRAYVLCLLAIC